MYYYDYNYDYHFVRLRVCVMSMKHKPKANKKLTTAYALCSYYSVVLLVAHLHVLYLETA